MGDSLISYRISSAIRPYQLQRTVYGARTPRTTPSQILVPHSMRIHDMERPLQPFGRNVNMAVALQGSRRHPEHLLLENPCDEAFRDFLKELAHRMLAQTDTWYESKWRLVVKPACVAVRGALTPDTPTRQ